MVLISPVYGSNRLPLVNRYSPQAVLTRSTAPQFGGGGKPALKAAEMVDFLVNNGFTAREGGNGHTVLHDGNGKRTTVPHQKRSLCPATMNSILNQTGLKQAFLALYGPKKKTSVAVES